MSTRTSNLDLFKWDTSNATDKASQFNIDTALNENWDKIDIAFGKKNDEIENLKAQIPTNTASGQVVNLTDATDIPLKNFSFDGKSEQKVGYVYTCDGTESGNYYYTYSSANYQFTMPTITSGDYILFNQNDLTFYKNGVDPLTTTQASTGTLLTMEVAPNPDYLIETKTIDVNSKIVGKNILKCKNFDTTYNGVKIKTNSDGSITFSGTTTGGITQRLVDTVYIKQTCICSGINDLTNLVLAMSVRRRGSSSTTFEQFENNVLYAGDRINYIYFQQSNTGRVVSGTIYPQIEAGTTKTSYEQYQEKTFLTENVEVRSITNRYTTSRDLLSINMQTGVITKTSNIKKIILNGTESGWSKQSTNSYGIANFQKTISDAIKLDQHDQYLMCDKLKQQTDVIANTTTEGILINNVPNIYVRIKSTRANSVADFKTWLSNNPLTVYYKLATPVEEVVGTLTQEQLEALKPIVGENTYQISSDVGSSNINLEYYQNIQILINNLTALVSST